MLPETGSKNAFIEKFELMTNNWILNSNVIQIYSDLFLGKINYYMIDI